MGKKETVLIITDGAGSTAQAAAVIAAALDDRTVVVRPAESFAGTDLLPARTFMIGCARPAPPSFAYLAELLAHINLAGRRCGIFSGSAGALRYLAALVRDSEAALGEPLLTGTAPVRPAAVKKWLKHIMV